MRQALMTGTIPERNCQTTGYIRRTVNPQTPSRNATICIMYPYADSDGVLCTVQHDCHCLTLQDIFITS